MKESVLDVLMYLVEHYLDVDTQDESDQALIRRQLTQAGFPPAEISKALAWLEGLTDEQETGNAEPRQECPSTRVYSSDELLRLDVESRGYLAFLEQAGVIDPRTRELIIDRVMALEAEAIDLDQLKWVVLMVLFNQPGNELASQWMEDLVFDGVSERLH